MKNKIILYIAASLDGFIARNNGSVDWLSSFENSEDDFGYKEFYDSVGIIVMGNTTYKQFGASKEFEEYYKNKPIFVFSRGMKGKRNNVTFVNENVIECVKKLQRENDKNIWLLGGASLVNEFLKYDLIDVFIITIIPILLGDGISLFKKEIRERKLKLVEVKDFNRGVVQLHYERIN